jgi:hypothetical protein
LLQERNGGALVLFFGNLGIGEGKRKEISRSQGNWSNRRWGRRWSGQEIRYHVCRARKVRKVKVKLRKEGKVTLLAGGKRSAGFGKGSNEGFVVSEKGKRTAFEEKTEMAEGKVGSEEFTIKGGIAGFRRRKLMGEESTRLPAAPGFLLKNSTNVGVRSIRC